MLKSLAGSLLKPHMATAATMATMSSMRWFSAAAAAVKRLYIGNLSFETKADDLAKHFEKYGAVHEVTIPLDHLGRSRGYGFVEMDAAAATDATSSLNQSTFMGRTIFVNDARPREERPDRGPRNRRRGGWQQDQDDAGDSFGSGRGSSRW